MTPDPGAPGPSSAPSAHRATVPLTKEPDPTERNVSSSNLKAGEDDRGHQAHRPWSARRLPAALVASVVLVAAGAALIDVVAVRVGRPAAAWRRHLADELATRPVDDIWMLTGAAVAAVVGIWLIVLALTPGLRHWLPLRSPAPRLRASLDRDSAADLLRDAAMRVPGVSKARIRVRRHRVKARADIRFRDPHKVKDDLTATLDDERDQLALARPPRIVVRVRRRTH
ncbi:DUF6286 domain-containing protein [Streptomyces sp. Ag109_G2-15]|uniref:DUF6286 domain-containing protein n=1 Tax=Streptomyces sp. Ag109_G2-15 TaxID=1938850 RepID=UPI000BDA0E5C|nr:DUF6286 domain-containing protein [Streptomyces sp. Ag109_G2-15]SOE07278.1 hypothetical protein SAMN06272765_8163 [Streptomyces sp. Ag109_G2-15]